MTAGLESRRRFLASLGGLAVAGAAPRVSLGVSAPEVSGSVFARGDNGYEIQRQSAVWQALKPPRDPALIVEARSEADIVETLRYARARGLPVAVRGGGHSYVASFLRESGILLDVSRLRDLRVRATSQSAQVQPGVRSEEFAAALADQGLAFPVAHGGSVTLGGYLLGGGIGWNGDQWGRAACFNVRAVDVVTAAGERLTVDAHTHPELYWAARGAGPAFCAVATRFHLRVFQLPRAIAASAYTYPLEALPELLEALSPATERHDPRLELTFALESGERSPGGEAARHCVVSAVCFARDRAEADAILGPLSRAVPAEGLLERREREPVTFAELLAASRTDTPRRIAADNVWAARPREALRRLGETFRKVPSPQSVCVANFRAHRTLVADAAYSVMAPAFMMWMSAWDDAGDDAVNLDWVDETTRALDPYRAGCYINETDFFRRPERARHSFSERAWRHLAEVHRRYDPDGRLPPPFTLAGT